MFIRHVRHLGSILCQYDTVKILWLYKFWISPLFSYFSFKSILAVGPLHFHIYFKIRLSPSVDQPTSNTIGLLIMVVFYLRTVQFTSL